MLSAMPQHQAVVVTKDSPVFKGLMGSPCLALLLIVHIPEDGRHKQIKKTRYKKAALSHVI